MLRDPIFTCLREVSCIIRKGSEFFGFLRFYPFFFFFFGTSRLYNPIYT